MAELLGQAVAGIIALAVMYMRIRKDLGVNGDGSLKSSIEALRAEQGETKALVQVLVAGQQDHEARLSRIETSHGANSSLRH